MKSEWCVQLDMKSSLQPIKQQMGTRSPPSLPPTSFPQLSITVHHTTFMSRPHCHHPPLLLLSTIVQYHSWYSPGCSTSPPHPEKSSSSSYSVLATQPTPHCCLGCLKLRMAATSPAGPASLLWPRKEPGGPPGSKGGRCGEEESDSLWALLRSARCAGCPQLWPRCEDSSGKGLEKRQKE